MNIYLFKSDIVPEKNMLVDDVLQYLTNLGFDNIYTVPDPQYFPLKMECDYNVEFNQSLVYAGEYNYLAVNVKPDENYLYFIVSYEWAGENVIKLHLRLDTVNTFLPNKDLSTLFTDKTTITRQHEDRFAVSRVNPSKLVRIVDKVDEGIHPIKYISSRTKINDSKLSARTKDWYLIYRNNSAITPDNPSQPVECYCVADVPLKIYEGGGSGQDVEYTPQMLSKSLFYFVDPINNPDFSFTGYRTASQDEYRASFPDSLIQCIYLLYIRDGESDISIKRLEYKKSGNYYVFTNELDIQNRYNKIVFHQCKSLSVLLSNANGWSDIVEANYKENVFAGSFPAKEIISINEVDKNDPFLIKIIKLPYAPDKFFFSGDTFSYSTSRWEIKRGMLKLKDLSTEFLNDLDDFSIDNELSINKPQISGNEALSDMYESKLYNSNFYSIRIVYDSFNYETPLELVELEESISKSVISFPVIFKPTNTINSNLLFKIDCSSTFFLSSFDFPNILVSNRNNEITIYNSEYIKYINYGYNRDKERLGRQNAMNWVNTSLSLGASVLGMGIGINSGKIAGGMIATSGFTGIQSAIGSIGSNIVSLIDNEASIAQKLDSAKLSGTTISGNNDNDLMSYYTDGNKLWKITSKCSDEIRKAVFKLFYYCGYARGYQGIPNFNTRIYFNYIQCSPVFNVSWTRHIKNEYIEDIISRFESGVTIFHKHKDRYDFAQTKENWEVSLL